MSLDKTFRALRLDSGAVVTKFDTDGTLAGNSDVYVPTQKAVKTYVDAAGKALQWKNTVRCATVSDGTLATAYANGQTVDGITLVTGNRILLKNQTDQTVNGIYTVNATGAPTRATDMDVAAEFPGAVVSVSEGTVNADSAWVCTNDSVTVGSSNIAFAIFGGIKAGTGLAFTADVLAIDTGVVTDLTTAQTLTNKRLTSPKINEDVVMSKTATEINAAVVASHTKEVRDLGMSFETGEQLSVRVYFPYKVTINKIRGIVTKAIAGSDNGTITCGNSTGASTAGVITATASDALAVEYSVTPSDNNVVLADGYYYLTSAKSTAGGKVMVSLEFTRTA